jgi:hypothetical protein
VHHAGHYTTLENTAPEQLLLGAANGSNGSADEGGTEKVMVSAVSSFEADSFQLGLCMLHLYTGDAPYEELLQVQYYTHHILY